MGGKIDILAGSESLKRSARTRRHDDKHLKSKIHAGKKMIIGTNTAIYLDGSFEEKTERISRAGYRGLGIGFSVVDDCKKWIGDINENDIETYKEILGKFKISSIHASHLEMKPLAFHPKYREVSQNEYIMNIELAGILSVPTVVMHPMEPLGLDPLWDNRGYDFEQIMKDFMLKIDQVAGRNNVKACWETGCGYFSPFERFDLIRELELKHTGICLDVGHMMLEWNNFGVGINKMILTIKDFILRYGDIIYDVHIHDWVENREKTPHGWNDHNFVGDGEINWNEVFGSLIEVGYEGILTCEFHPLVVENNDKKLAENREHICALIERAGGNAE